MSPISAISAMTSALSQIQQMIHIALQRERWVAWGVIVSANQSAYTVRVAVQPGGEISESIELMPPYLGANPPIITGSQVIVLLERSRPLCALGPFHSNDEIPWPVDLTSVRGDMMVSGILSSGTGVLYPARPALPPATSDWAGVLLRVGPENATSADADAVYICLRSTTNTFSWKLIASG
jgi:hypothetical protein